MTDIFVFGSNLAGIHGAGSALHAKKYCGAILGQGVGPQGNSYAIPTKDLNVYDTLPLAIIKIYVDEFLKYAEAHPELNFKVVEIGCGLAGYTREEIAPMFKGHGKNVTLTWNFREVLGEN